MSRKWTKAGIVIVAAIMVVIIAVISLGGGAVISKVVKEMRMKTLSEPPTEIALVRRGSGFESLWKAFQEVCNQASEGLAKAEGLVGKYPNDDRPRKNREEWKKYIGRCDDRFVSALKEISGSETAIQASTFEDLKREYRRRVKHIDQQREKLSGQKKLYVAHGTNKIVAAVRNLRQTFEQAHYGCPQHKSFCKKCISQAENCKACGGDGKWGFWNYRCQLCKGTGIVQFPGRTYCPNCHGRWDDGWNCSKCNRSGLVDCPSHDVGKTVCPICGTVDGHILGQSLE